MRLRATPAADWHRCPAASADGRDRLRQPPLRRRSRRWSSAGSRSTTRAGLAGHSDADVLTHAVIDAILGAGGGGDIGTMFPDDDEQWQGADSIDLLRTVVGTDRRPDRQRRRDADLRGAATGSLQGGDGADARRRDLGPGQRQGDHQRGHGLDRPGRGHRLYRGRLGAERIVFGAMGILTRARRNCGASAADSIFEVKVLQEAGVVGPMRPDKAAKIASTFLRWGASPATGASTAAIHHPHEIAIVDERGALSFERLHRRSNALARSFAAMGIGDEDGIGIMCRNHRGFVEASSRRRQARRQRPLPQHDVRRAAVGRGDASREAEGAGLRLRVRRAARRRRRLGRARGRLGSTRARRPTR